MKRGEVWLVDFSPSVGDEITKKRPAVIVNNDDYGNLDLCIVVPITALSKPSLDLHVRIRPNEGNNLHKECYADCFQVKCFSTLRFQRQIGRLSFDEMSSVKMCLANVLDIT